MKAAWNYVKSLKISISEGLKKAWKSAKTTRTSVKMNVNSIFTVNAVTGEVFGKTYQSKDFLKKNFNAKWNADKKIWTVDVEKFNSELDNCPNFYKIYIINEEKSEEKVIVDKKLVNHADGFYCHTYYNDGTSSVALIG